MATGEAINLSINFNTGIMQFNVSECVILCIGIATMVYLVLRWVGWYIKT